MRQLKLDRKSTRLNSSHLVISYAVFCLKKKTEFATRLGPQCLRSLRGRARRAHVSQTGPARCTPEGPPGAICALAGVLFFFLMIRRPPSSTLFPYTPLSR